MAIASKSSYLKGNFEYKYSWFVFLISIASSCCPQQLQLPLIGGIVVMSLKKRALGLVVVTLALLREHWSPQAHRWR